MRVSFGYNREELTDAFKHSTFGNVKFFGVEKCTKYGDAAYV